MGGSHKAVGFLSKAEVQRKQRAYGMPKVSQENIQICFEMAYRTEAHRLVKILLGEKSEADDPRAYIGVDLDGTLARYTGWKGTTSIGSPIPAMVRRVRQWVSHGKKVKIFTARADDEKSVNAIKKWLKDNELPDLEVTNLKDQYCVKFYDDRAVHVHKNTGKIREAGGSFHGVTHYQGCGHTSRCRCGCLEERTVDGECFACTAGLR